MYVTLRSSTCFEQHAAHHQEDQLYHHSLWYRHSSQTAVQYALHLHTVRLLTEGDDTRGVVIQFVLLRMSSVLLETCRGAWCNIYIVEE